MPSTVAVDDLADGQLAEALAELVAGDPPHRAQRPRAGRLELGQLDVGEALDAGHGAQVVGQPRAASSTVVSRVTSRLGRAGRRCAPDAAGPAAVSVRGVAAPLVAAARSARSASAMAASIASGVSNRGGAASSLAGPRSPWRRPSRRRRSAGRRRVGPPTAAGLGRTRRRPAAAGVPPPPARATAARRLDRLGRRRPAAAAAGRGSSRLVPSALLSRSGMSMPVRPLTVRQPRSRSGSRS